MKRLAIITTHPIQYNAPLFKLLSSRGKIGIKVFYTWGEQVTKEKFDPGFGKNIQWDIPLLEGYDYKFMSNIAAVPGSHHFRGIDNPSLIDSVKNWKADAVLVYGWNFKSHLKTLRYFHGKIPVYFRGDSNLIDSVSAWKKSLRMFFLKWVYRYVDKVLYVGTNNKKYFESLGFTESKLIFAPHAVENERFMPNKNNILAANKLRDKLCIRKEHKVFLFAGKLEPKKNCRHLIEVFKEIGHLDSHLLIVGNGVLKQELESSAAAFENIHFMDFQNQRMMPVVYSMADVFVLPSRGPGETWGLSINEAMASGKPVLVSDICGAAIDLVKEGTNGYVFHSGDSKDLNNKMQKFLQPEADLQKMGQASIDIIANWNYERDCQAIESLLI